MYTIVVMRKYNSKLLQFEEYTVRLIIVLKNMLIVAFQKKKNEYKNKTIIIIRVVPLKLCFRLKVVEKRTGLSSSSSSLILKSQ